MLGNNIAIVTGAASGIGLGVATRLAEEGARVIMADIREEDVLAAAGKLAKRGLAVAGRPTDVTDEPAVRDLVAFARAQSRSNGRAEGGLDILVNCHGLLAFGPLETAPKETWDRIMGVNAYGAWRTMAAALPAMRAAGGGSIVNISSVNGIRAYEGAGIYNASKAALNMISQVMALETARDNIRVNLVLPGTVEETGFIPSVVEAGDVPHFYRALAGVHPLGRNARVADVVNCVLFLVSDAAAYVTGTLLNVDGGRHMATNRPPSGREKEASA